MVERFVLKKFADELDIDNKVATGQFGSFQATGAIPSSSGILTNNPVQIQGLPAWSKGWKSASRIGGNKLLPRAEEFNAIHFNLSSFALQNYNDGITYWTEGLQPVQYQTIVQYQPANATAPCIYFNKTGVNTSTPPDQDTTNWALKFDLSKTYLTDASGAVLNIDWARSQSISLPYTVQDYGVVQMTVRSISYGATAYGRVNQTPFCATGQEGVGAGVVPVKPGDVIDVSIAGSGAGTDQQLFIPYVQ